MHSDFLNQALLDQLCSVRDTIQPGC